MRNPVQAEQRALQTIQAHWRGKLGGKSFSPLENLDGTNPILETLQELKDSPLCKVATEAWGFDHPTDLLRELEELYERALIPWEHLRTVQPPACFSLVYCGDSTPLVHNIPSIYNRWPYGTFPREVRRESRYRFWELVTTSRMAVDGNPSKHALLELNPISPPFQFVHVACLAAIVCIVEALNQYIEVLEDWEGVVQQAAPGLPYTWLLQSDPGRVEHILSEHLSESLDDDDLTFQTSEIRAKTDRAIGWLTLAEMSEEHQSEIEVTTTKVAAKATTEAMQAAKNARAEQARDASKRPRRSKPKVTDQHQAKQAGRVRIEAPTVEDWVQYLRDHPPKRGAMEATKEDFASLRGVGKSTVDRRHREAKEKNLLS
jgi:hypothetical protein